MLRYFRSNGWPALAIHGDKDQSEREWVLQQFKDGKHPVMVATEVAARGLGKFIFFKCISTFNFMLRYSRCEIRCYL